VDSTASLTLGEAVGESSARVGMCVVGKGHYDSPTELVDRVTGIANISASYAFGAHAFEVEVDEDTGLVRVLRVVAVHDVGRALNPTAVEGQIEGAVAQGLGFALFEEQRFREGRVENPTLHDQRPVTAMDVPPIAVHIVETDDDEGPFGAKGVGESGLIPCAPAISNAVYDAIGVRFRDLPLTPERVLGALRSA
jgi:CO/xanthine dehydrogenase Mo-binding subunit